MKYLFLFVYTKVISYSYFHSAKEIQQPNGENNRLLYRR